MKKVLLQWASMFLLAMLSMTNGIAANYDFELDGIYYTYDLDKKEAQVVKSPNGYSGNIEIPATVTYGRYTFNVTTIANNAFAECSGVTSITLPNTLMYVGQRAFYNCTGLTVLNIPDNIHGIDKEAFYGLSKLNEISLPKNLDEYLGNKAFYGLGVKELVIPDTWEEWDAENVFGNMARLERLTVGKNIEHLNDFNNATKLKSVLFIAGNNSKLTSLGGFDNSGLSELPVLPESVTELSGFGNNKFTSISIPAHIKKITSFGRFKYPIQCNIRKIVFEESQTPLEFNDSYSYFGKPREIYFGRNIIDNRYFGIETTYLETIWLGWYLTEMELFSSADIETLKAIYARSEHPDQVKVKFSKSICSNATLYVPQTKVSAYGETSGWEDFFFIEERGDMHNLDADISVRHSTIIENPDRDIPSFYRYTYQTQGDSIIADVTLFNNDGYAYTGQASVQVLRITGDNKLILIDEKTIDVSLSQESKKIYTVVFEGLQIKEKYQLVVHAQTWGSMMYLNESDLYKLVYPTTILHGNVNLKNGIQYENNDYVRSGMDQEILVQVRNDNDVTFNETLYLIHDEYGDYYDEDNYSIGLKTSNNMKITNTNIPSGETKTLSIPIGKCTLNRIHHISIYSSEYDYSYHRNALCSTPYFISTDKWRDLSGTAVVLDTKKNEQQQTVVGTNATISFIFENNDLLPFNDKIEFVLWQKNTDDFSIKYTGSETFNIESGEQTTFKYQLENLKNGAEYFVSTNYKSLDKDVFLTKSEVFLVNQDYINGIELVSDNNGIQFNTIYTINGLRVRDLQKGVNIIRMKNGTTKKVLVK